MHPATRAIGGVGAAVAVVCRCSVSTGTATTPTVSGDALENEIDDRLTKAGETPQSATCAPDLVGQLGITARCEVVLSATNSFEPVVTVTRVDGATIGYEMTPAVSKEQLETAVSRLVAADGVPVDSVSCVSGLDGEVGAVAQCDVVSEGVTAPAPSPSATPRGS